MALRVRESGKYGTQGQRMGKFVALGVRGLGSDSCLLVYETLGKVITFTELRLPQ